MRHRNSTFKFMLALSVASTGFASTAYAQNFQTSVQNGEEDEIIVTALRAISKADVTASLTTLDAVDLDIRNTPFIADQLRAVPGVGVSRSGALGALTQIRIRGAEANHTLVTLDGIEVSDPITGETDFGLWSGLDINQIDVVRGEQSVLYGSDAIGGVVSLSSSHEGGFRAAGEYGSFDTLRGHIGYTTEFQGASFGVSAAGFTTDGVDTSGLGGERDGSESYSVLANSKINLSEDWLAAALISLRRSNVQSDPDSNFDGILENADLDNETQQILIGATLKGQTGLFSHAARVSFGHVIRENFEDNSFTDETEGERFKFSYSPSVSFEREDKSLTLSALLDWENEEYERIDTDTFFGDPNQTASFETFGISGEARARFYNLALNGSIRVDDNNGQFENATTWRLGAAYNTGFGGKLRASTGVGVKNPTFTELFGFFPASFIGNPDLNPEQSQSWEIGYDQSFGDRLTASVTYFEADLEDEITTSFPPPLFLASPVNLTEESARSGIEFGLSWDINDSLSFRGSASHINSDDTNEETEIRVPEFTASGALNWQSLSKEGLRAAIALDYVGAQDDFNFGTFPATRVKLDPYALLSATLEYPVAQGLALTLRGDNLLDEEITDVFGFNGPGAGVFVGFKIQ